MVFTALEESEGLEADDTHAIQICYSTSYVLGLEALELGG